MKQKRISSLIALTISLEMVISPIPAMAQQQGNGLQNAMTILNMGMSTYSTIRGAGQAQMPAHVGVDMQAFQKQLTPQVDKHFNLANLQKIPGLMEYIAKKNQDAQLGGGKVIQPMQLNCNTLQTTIHEAKNEICRSGKISTVSGVSPQAQADEAFAYYNQYSQISKQYRNYTVRTNTGNQAFGYGCMQDAMDILHGFFKYRTEQLDVVMANLKKKIGDLENNPAAVAALTEVKRSSAFLNGEGSNFASDFQDSDLFNYAKAIGSNQCGSMFAGDTMNTNGKQGGLKGLKENISQAFGTKIGNYTPQDMVLKQGDVIKDIEKMATKVSERAKLDFAKISGSPNGYSEFLNGIGSDVGSDSGAHNGLNKAFFNDLQTDFAKERQVLTDDVNLLKSELAASGVNTEDAFSRLTEESDGSFEAEVTSMENQMKGTCLIKNNRVAKALKKIRDVTVSSSNANQQSTNQIREEIEAIISDINLAPDVKLKRLQEIEASSGSRYEVKLDADYKNESVGADGKIQKTVVNASTSITPSKYFSDIIQNCESQHAVNKLKNKMTAKDAIRKLRTLKKDYQKLSRSHSEKIRKEIVNKMVNCGGNTDTQSSRLPGSCSPESLDMTKPGFCAKGAISCSKNMMDCNNKVTELFNKTRASRETARDEFNANVEKVRVSVVGIFDNTLKKYLAEGELMRGMFGAGFKAPDFETDVPDTDPSKFNPLFNEGAEKLKVKDPKAYLKMVAANMENLKQSIEAQQEQILGGSIESPSGILAKHAAETKANYEKQVIGPADQMANQCLAAYNQYDAMMTAQKTAQDQLQGELGEKRADACNKFDGMMNEHPNEFCKGDPADTMDALIKTASKAGDAATVSQARQARVEMQQHCRRYMDQNPKEDYKPTASTLQQVCSLAKSGNANAKEMFAGVIDAQDPKLSSVELVCKALGANAFKDKAIADKLGCEDKSETVAVGTGSTTKDVVKFDCAAVGNQIAADYDLKTGKNVALTASRNNSDVPPPSFGVTASFCGSSNNAGFNTKGNLPFQNPLNGGPMAGNQGLGF